MGPDSYELVSNFDPEQDCHVITLRVLREPPLRLGILAGEFVQQMRSSLDHLALQLARLKNPRIRRATFPIYTDRGIYTTPAGSKKRSPQDVCRRLFRPQELAILERMQPYNQPIVANSGLAILQKFSNLDKHSLIQTPFGQAQQFQLRSEDPEAHVEIVSMTIPAGAVHDGTEFVRYRVFTPDDRNVDMKHTVRLSIGFGEDAVPYSVLSRLGVGVIGIIDEFERAIPEFRP